MAKAKIQVQVIFDAVLSVASKVEGFNPSTAELALIRKAFDGVLNKAQTEFRKTPQSWCGYVRRDGTIDEAARQQCLESAFCRMLHYHAGRSGAYLGTILNATDNLGSMATAFGLVPHADVEGWYMLPVGSPEREEASRLRDENRTVERKFADYCDTFCQSFVYVSTKGRESSVTGAQWRQALGVA